MVKRNKDIRRAMRIAEVFTWQVAEKLGVSEPTIYRWLREKEMPAERQLKFFQAIEEAQKDNERTAS